MTYTSIWNLFSVKTSTLIEGWPHTVVFGHQLARTCLVKQTLLASQMSFSPTRGTVAALGTCEQVRGTKGSLMPKAPSSGAAATTVLPQPLPGIQRRLVSWWSSPRARNSAEGEWRRSWMDMAVCDLGVLRLDETSLYCFVSGWPQLGTYCLTFVKWLQD